MRTPEELLDWVRRQWLAHPDDYDPTDEQMLEFIAAVQRDAIEGSPLPDVADRQETARIDEQAREDAEHMAARVAAQDEKHAIVSDAWERNAARSVEFFVTGSLESGAAICKRLHGEDCGCWARDYAAWQARNDE